MQSAKDQFTNMSTDREWEQQPVGAGAGAGAGAGKASTERFRFAHITTQSSYMWYAGFIRMPSALFVSFFLSVFLSGCGVCSWSCDMEQAFWPQHAHNVHMAAKIYLQLCWDIIPFDRLRATTPAHLQSFSLSPSISISVYFGWHCGQLQSDDSFGFGCRSTRLCLQLGCNWAVPMEQKGEVVEGGRGGREGQAVAETMCWIICAIYVALISLWGNENQKELSRAEP